MYVSFGFSTAIFLIVLFILSLFVKEITTLMVGVAVLVVVVGLLPIMFRLSRVLWINIFVRYEGPCSLIPKK
jgi:accessory gene regulator protein AgrB